MSDNEGKVLHATVGQGERTVRQADVIAKEPDMLEVPIREVDTMESITLGFRATMFTLKDEDGNGGEVCSGGGFGSEWIELEWVDGDKKRKAAVRGTELLKAWVATFDPEAAANFPEGIR